MFLDDLLAVVTLCHLQLTQNGDIFLMGGGGGGGGLSHPSWVVGWVVTLLLSHFFATL